MFNYSPTNSLIFGTHLFADGQLSLVATGSNSSLDERRCLATHGEMDFGKKVIGKVMMTVGNPRNGDHLIVM